MRTVGKGSEDADRGRSAALSKIRLPACLLPVIRKAAELGEKMDRGSAQ